MIDIPTAYVLIVEENDEGCCKCFFYDKKKQKCFGRKFNCTSALRNDGKNVIFKLIYQPKEEK